MAFRKRIFKKFGRTFKKGYKKFVGRARRSFKSLKRRFARVRRSSGFSSRGGVLRGG